ncbi:MAG: alpha-amylase family glycosyl hydrolase [Candidatus Hodarchaeales archaeon]
MNNDKWWQKAVFYQIYPRSFKDSTNNGIGDLNGIISKLDYLKELGVDAIWFSPFYPSPQDDFGYDITDYTDINPEYGTMNDFDTLLERCHNLDLKVIVDLVLNHTSDKHSWFIESSSSRDNSKADWYVWMDGRGKNNRKPPNNWKSLVGGSMWEWNENRQQFYLHQFLKCQPDLNWRNTDVQETMLNVVQFWLDKGVDGYRLDIIHTLFEDIEFRNNPHSFHLFPSYDTTSSLFQSPKYTQFLPETIEMCKRIRKIVDSYTPTRMLVGEASGGPKIISPLYGDKNDGLNLLFNFKFAATKFSAKAFYHIIQETERILNEPYWPCYFYSNHDIKRMISRHGNNENKARLLMLMLLTLRGTPFIYYGEEIGMPQVNVPRDQIKDPIAFLKVFGVPIGKFYGRDGCRTPMQWNNSSINAGFSPDPNISPWLPISHNVDIANVESQLEETNSMLHFMKTLLSVRKSLQSLQIGNFSWIERNGQFIIYQRAHKNQRTLIYLNFSKRKLRLKSFENSLKIFSSVELKTDERLENEFTLDPYEGVIVQAL